MDSLSQELPPLGEWAATPELIVGAIVAAFTAVSFWQSWYLAVKYERRGLQRGIARSLFNNHVCLFLGCGIVSASALWSALWLKAGGQERPCTVQLALPLISPLPIGVSIFTITRALSNMNEVLKEMKVMPETKSAVARIREKWYLCCWFSFAVSLQLAFGNVIGTFFKKDIFSGSFMSQVDDSLVYFAFWAAILILSKLSSRGILGLVSVVSLVSLLFILSRCIMLYRYYQEEDLTRSNYEWLLNSIFDALSVMVFLLALTLFNMSGSVFYAAYEVSKVRIEAPLDDQKQETDSYALLVSYGAMA